MNSRLSAAHMEKKSCVRKHILSKDMFVSPFLSLSLSLSLSLLKWARDRHKTEIGKGEIELTLRASVQEHAAVLEEIPWDIGQLFELVGHGDNDRALAIDVESPLENVGGVGSVLVG